jgi:hypothetical protein
MSVLSPPQNDDFNARNLTFDARDVTWLRGNFKLSISYTDDADKNIFHLTTYGYLKS